MIFSRERGRGQKWYWRTDRAGWPDLEKAASGGAKMVREGDFRVRVWETSWRVRAMETWPESVRISEASRTVSEGREEERERREKRARKDIIGSEAAIDGNWSFRAVSVSVGVRVEVERKAYFWREMYDVAVCSFWRESQVGSLQGEGG